MRRQLSGRGEILLAGQLLAGEHVPQPELDLEPAVALARDAAGDERLRVDARQSGKRGQRIEAGDLLDEGRRIDRREQAGAAQVGGDHLADAARDLGVARRAADEIRERDRQRLRRCPAVTSMRVAAPARRPRRAGTRRARRRRARAGAGGEAAGNRSVTRHGTLVFRKWWLTVSRGTCRADRNRPRRPSRLRISRPEGSCNGAQLRTARIALSAATWNAGWLPRFITCGSAEQGAVLLELDADRHDQSRASASADRQVPALAQPRAQRIDLVLRQRRGAPGRGAERRACCSACSPVAARRCGSRLSSSAAICVASNFGCGFGGSTFFGGCRRLGLLLPASVSGFLSVFLQRFGDRIDLRLRLLGFGLLRLGLRAPASAASARASSSGSGFGCDLVGGRRRSRASRPPWRPGSRPASARATFSTSGFGVSALGAVFDALRHLREVGRRDDVDRQRIPAAARSAAGRRTQ